MYIYNKNISARAITKRLKTEFTARNIKYMPTVDSTNEEAKRCYDYPDGSLFIADTQTAGKGRLGRQWTSDKGTGIYMSLLLKPDIPPEKLSQITLVAGIALCRALGHGSLIKWPNDIIIGSKKVCGILTETFRAGNVDYVVCGTGINVTTPRFDGELSDKATSLFIETGKKFPRNKIIADIMNEFEKLYEIFLKEGFSPLLDEYRSLCAVIGREISVIYKNDAVICKAVDIDENGGLIADINGETVCITSGEVSVRGIYGYI